MFLSLSLLALSNALVGDYNITHVQAANQGHRQYMEDRCDIQEYGDWYYFGVFDGHGGDFVSQYLKENLGDEIKKNISKNTNTSISDRLIQVFEQANAQLKKDHLQESLHCGSTAIVALVNKKNGTVYFVNTGDSRAISSLSHSTVDHKPTCKNEILRVGKHNIWENGIMRLGGSLAITRSFGDFDLEKHGLIATPEISTFTIDSDHASLVLATDGIWDKLSNDEVRKIVKKCCLDKDKQLRKYWHMTNGAQQIIGHAINPKLSREKYNWPAAFGMFPDKLLKEAHDNQLAIVVNINKK